MEGEQNLGKSIRWRTEIYRDWFGRRWSFHGDNITMSTMILNSGDKKIVSPAAESKKSSIVWPAPMDQGCCLNYALNLRA